MILLFILLVTCWVYLYLYSFHVFFAKRRFCSSGTSVWWHLEYAQCLPGFIFLFTICLSNILTFFLHSVILLSLWCPYEKRGCCMLCRLYPWGQFVTFGYINIMDLTWLMYQWDNKYQCNRMKRCASFFWYKQKRATENHNWTSRILLRCCIAENYMPIWKFRKHILMHFGLLFYS